MTNEFGLKYWIFKRNGIEKNQSPRYAGSLNEPLSFRMEMLKF